MTRSKSSDPVVRLLTAAFLDDPVLGWVFPDRTARPVALTVLVSAFVRNGLVRTANSAGLLCAAAVWATPAEHDLPAPDQPSPALVPYLDRLARLDELLAERYPVGTDHRYLRVIGVRPEARGRGHGGALLRRGLAEIDAAGLPAYLEGSAPRNSALYARHGFRPYGPPIRLPDGPELYPMWRDPQPRSTVQDH